MNPTDKQALAWLDQELADLDRRNLRRRLRTREGVQAGRIVLDGRELVNFGSNDYLGLAADPRLAAALAQAVERDGWGSGASPLVTGHAAPHRLLEQRLAEFEGTEAALLFTSGFAANAGTIAALVGPGDVVYGDSKNHASLWDGCRLSRADVRVYPHRDWRQLEALLADAAAVHRAGERGTGPCFRPASFQSSGVNWPKNGPVPARPVNSCDDSQRYRRRLIVTDTLFSMDGDLAPLVQLADLAERHDAMLMVDEAHATGVFGAHGRGLAEQLGTESRVHVRVCTLSKALGSIGGFVAGSRTLIEWLVNRARPYIFSTAAPAAIAAAAIAALDIVRDEPQRRTALLARAEELRHTLRAAGWNVDDSASQIIPVVVGDAARAVALSQVLYDCGLFVPAIRPPTVPEGEACLRISLTAAHTDEMIAELVVALGQRT